MNQKFIVRTEKAGVFFGEIKERNGSEVTMTNVRKLWYWNGASAVEQIALEGVTKPRDCKFTVTVPEMIILGGIQIVPCTDQAVTIIDSIEAWKQ